MIERITDFDLLGRVDTTVPEAVSGGQRLLVTAAYSDTGRIGTILDDVWLRDRHHRRYPWSKGSWDQKDYHGAVLNPEVQVGDHILALDVAGVPRVEGQAAVVVSLPNAHEPRVYAQFAGDEGRGWYVTDWVKVAPVEATTVTGVNPVIDRSNASALSVGDRVEVIEHEGNAYDTEGKIGTVREVSPRGWMIRLDGETDADGRGWGEVSKVRKVTSAPASTTGMVKIEDVRRVARDYRHHSRTVIDGLVERLAHGDLRVNEHVGPRWHVERDGEQPVATFADKADADAYYATKTVEEVDFALVERLVEAAGRQYSWCGTMRDALNELRPTPPVNPHYTALSASLSSEDTKEPALYLVGEHGSSHIIRAAVRRDGEVRLHVDGRQVHTFQF